MKLKKKTSQVNASQTIILAIQVIDSVRSN
jgi:hypothetical protein